MSENAQDQKQLSLKEIASLSLAERHKILDLLSPPQPNIF